MVSNGSEENAGGKRAARAMGNRISLTNEWHARPNIGLPPPFRCTHILSLREPSREDVAWREISSFCEELGQSGPATDSRFHVITAGNCLLKWESHTEATSHTLLVPGNAQTPFSETALDFLSDRKRDDLLDRLFVGVHVEVMASPGGDDPSGYALARSILGASSIYGGEMSSSAATVWSSFRLDAQGFMRLVVFDHGMNEHRAGRLLQRLLDMETYRMLAMRALPIARHVMSSALELEPKLSRVMEELSAASTLEDRERALHQITELSAQAEELLASHASSFSGARAYARIVERRVEEVNEEVVAGHQRYTNFLMRALAPAMRTCDAAELRVSSLAERVARSANLLGTMVSLQQSRHNQGVLKSMADSARRQLRLQQAVEGFSIFAISYYAVGLTKYFLDSLEESGFDVNATLLSGLAAPLVFAGVFLSVRMVRKRLLAKRDAENA